MVAGIITDVCEHTEWINSIVPVKKPGGWKFKTVLIPRT